MWISTCTLRQYGLSGACVPSVHESSTIFTTEARLVSVVGRALKRARKSRAAALLLASSSRFHRKQTGCAQSKLYEDGKDTDEVGVLIRLPSLVHAVTSRQAAAAANTYQRAEYVPLRNPPERNSDVGEAGSPGSVRRTHAVVMAQIMIWNRAVCNRTASAAI